ncbi:hypothetical protein BpHYR1_030339 [Brachionus plicatilis]|uniref:Uncharacterized protein n=1 Tax=Brachionus plicatilis TaxID=10195 RepID=A0A3M7PK83_BRAPC|nr:hypothetical protein BpHYR1_030339 [Brachionus plicatilis]
MRYEIDMVGSEKFFNKSTWKIAKSLIDQKFVQMFAKKIPLSLKFRQFRKKIPAELKNLLKDGNSAFNN